MGRRSQSLINASPAILLLTAGLLIPLLAVLRLTSTLTAQKAVEIIAGNSDAIFYTIIQATASTIGALALGIPAAYLLARRRLPFHNVIRAATLTPFVVPSILVSLSFALFFGNNGLLNRALMSALNLTSPPLPILYGFWTIILAHTVYNFPAVARFVSDSWERADASTQEAAETLGASKWTIFRKITFPHIKGSLLSISVLVFTYCALSFAIPLTLGGIKYGTIEVAIYQTVTRDLNPAAGALLSLLQAAFLIAFSTLTLSTQRTLTFTGKTNYREKLPLKINRNNIWVIPYALLITLITLGPAASVIAYSLTANNGQPTLTWYQQIIGLTPQSAIGAGGLIAIRNTLLIGISAATLAVIAGFSLAVARKTHPTLARTITYAPVAFSTVTLGLGFLLTYPTGRWWTIAFAHAVIALPFTARILTHALENLPPAYAEAAETLGANRKLLARKITLPLLTPSVITAGSFAFAVSAGELAAVSLLSDGAWPTMPVYIYRFLASRQPHGAAAMGVTLALITLAALIVIEKADNKK
ncbi:Molybdate/tungstate transport system permease protein WtpB [uncultured archaeon]|nr:Molybdate/tungstate transport system permease protein WtpB [uncultured archaeon]